MDKLFIGIDVSKDTVDVCCYQENKPAVNGKFENEVKGFKKMLKWVAAQDESPCQRWLVCLEHTGVYSWALSCFLGEKEIPFSIQPALQIKRSLGIQRGKNDRADAQMIARYAYLYRKEIKPTQLPSKALICLKNLLSYRSRLVRNKVSLQTSSQELDAYMTEDLTDLIVKDSTQHIKLLEASIRQIDKRIEKIIHQDTHLDRLYNLSTSVTGVGLQIAANMLVCTEGFTRFENFRKFSCYCGLAPFEYQSGTSIKGKTRTSELGNKKMKALIGNGVASAIQHDPEIAAYYNRKLAEGKHKLVVQTAIKNKIISRVFATVKRGTPFVPLFQYAA